MKNPSLEEIKTLGQTPYELLKIHEIKSRISLEEILKNLQFTEKGIKKKLREDVKQAIELLSNSKLRKIYDTQFRRLFAKHGLMSPIRVCKNVPRSEKVLSFKYLYDEKNRANLETPEAYGYCASFAVEPHKGIDPNILYHPIGGEWKISRKQNEKFEEPKLGNIPEIEEKKKEKKPDILEILETDRRKNDYLANLLPEKYDKNL